jgi:hypothetical protein
LETPRKYEHPKTYRDIPKEERKHQIMTGGNPDLPCCETLREKQGVKILNK